MKIAMLALLLILPLAGVAEEQITACDIEAAHPSDPDHVGAGRGSSQVVTHRAIPACREAVAQQPENPRFHYQLGRALVYWADGNNADVSEGVEHVRHAAEMDYTQALFVLGLMHIRAGDVCAAEPVTRRAADKGLKSARISYVNSVTAGDYDACGISATAQELQAYLEGAREQVSGYYENMLLASLQRQLDARQEQ